MARDFAEQGGEVALPAKQMPHRRGDGRRRQSGGCHLVQQRLEQVVVGPVHQRDFHRGVAQRAGRLQPAEAAADDHDARNRDLGEAMANYAKTSISTLGNGLCLPGSGRWHHGGLIEPFKESHVPHRHRRQPAQAGLAGRNPEALAPMEGRGRRIAPGQGRCNLAVDQGAGGRGPGHSRRRRTVAPAFRPRLPRAGRGHRLRAQGEDGHPRQPLRRDGAAGGGAAEAQGPGPCLRGATGAGPHETQAQVHAAGADDHRRHGGRPLLWRQGQDGVRFRASC